MALKFQFPLKSKVTITSRFGWRTSPKVGWHSGTDMISADHLLSIYSCYKGKVIFTGWRGNYGKTVIVHHNTCGNVWSLYAHLYSIKVEAGQEVDLKSILGIMGSTGYSFGAHLHWEIRFPFNSILACHNPEIYLT